MKQNIKIIALLLLPALLLSCGLFANFGKADVRIDIAPVASAGIGDPYARIWLTADGELLPLDAENAYLAAQLEDMGPTTVIIEGIPVGPRYRVLVAVGILEDGWFDTGQWGESAEFTLEPGVNTPVDLFMQGSPFGYTFDLRGKPMVDVEVVGGTIYAAEAATLWSSASLFSTFNPTPIEPGYSANSLTDGIDFDSGAARLWINSNKGILPFYVTVAPVFDTAFSVNLGSVPVLDSATRPSGSDHIAYFSRAGGLGGVYAPYLTLPNSWTWVNLDSENVYDLITLDAGDGSGEGYFAAPGGAFRLPQAFLEDPTPTTAEHKLPLKPPAKVLSWELMYDNYGDGDLLFLGTADGAWQVTVTGGVWETPLRIAGTEGEAIIMTETTTSGSNQYAAFLTPLALYVYVDIFGGATTLTRYPFYSGLPEKVTGMDFSVEFTSSMYLMISSGGGLFYVYAGPA